MKLKKELPVSTFYKCLFGFFTVAFLLAAVVMPDRANMLTGLGRIVSEPSKVTTNYFSNGGYAASFLNAGLVCFVCSLLYCLPKAKPNATSCLAFLLTAGFCFWGINVVNIWFSMAGVLLYCAVKRQNPAQQVNAMLFSTGIAPLITDLMIRYPNAEAAGFSWQGILLALGVGLVIGFFLPAGLAASAKIHRGFSLYSAAVPVGLTAFFLQACLYKVLGAELPAAPAAAQMAEVSSKVANIFCIVVFGVCVVAGVALGCRPKDYWELLKDSGKGVDFAAKYSPATALTNLGLFGLFIILYYNAVGASWNAVTFGCVFCMVCCGCSGSHPFNVCPIMVGYVAASLVGRWCFVGSGDPLALNTQAIAVGLCFANGLSPISGHYGWFWGVVAGMIHFILVTCVPSLHGGFCLYNGGFTAAFTCMMLLPVLEHFMPENQDKLVTQGK